MTAVRLENVSRTAGGETHLSSVDLTVEAGTFLTLLGPMRAGKTSLLRVIAGLDRPDDGSVFVDGSVAMVYQEFVNYPSFTVRENIASPLVVSGVAHDEIARRVGEIAERLGLSSLLERRPEELSGGQQQRVALGRALAKDADVVLLDEPLANLDFKLREELRGELSALFGDGRRTVLYATTDPAEALGFGGDVAVLDEGRVLQSGSARAVYDAPANERVAEQFARTTTPPTRREDRPVAAAATRVSFEGVAHRYEADAPYALHPLDLTLAAGKTHALLGPSGCGKTTLLNIVSGLIQPTAGRLAFDGKNVTDVPTRDRRVAQVFQFPVVYDSMTVRRNLAFPLENRAVPRERIASRVDEIARLLGLSDVLDRRPRALATDVRQRVALGRGLVREDVAAILLDEPLTAVDPAFRATLRDTLKSAQTETGKTLVYVTHDQGEAMDVADEIVVMNEGRVVQQGPSDELFARPAHEFVATFLGSPGMNLLAGTIAGGGVRLGAAGSTERRMIGVRPEDVRFVVGADATAGSWVGTVERVEDEGYRRVVTVRVEGSVMKAALSEATPPPELGACRVTFDAARAHAFVDGTAVS